MPSRKNKLLASQLLATTALMFWLCLEIWIAGMAKLCPDGCWCDHKHNYVKCSSLNSIPKMFPTGVQGIFIQNSNITYLVKEAFDSRRLEDLLVLMINHCQVKTIEVGAFTALRKLIVLSLTGNEIREIIAGTLLNMNSLEHLYLWDNPIDHLEFDAFLGLDTLTDIHL
jgi:hypothetical protein